MDGQDIALKFELVDGRYPEAENVAAALAAYADMLKTAASIIDPESSLAVEVLGVEQGSQIFLLLLRRVEQFAERVNSGAAQYPLVSQLAIAGGGLIATTLMGVGATALIQGDTKLDEEQMAVFEKMGESLAASAELQKQGAAFFETVNDEPAYQEIRILGPDKRPIFSVPRSEFAARTGLFTQIATVEEKVERRSGTWDVTLIKPTLKPKALRWRFAREGIEFSAVMADRSFLEALHHKMLPIQIAEGVTMKIEVHYDERYTGSGWVPEPSTMKVVRVISPLPPAPSTPMFPAASPP